MPICARQRHFGGRWRNTHDHFDRCRFSRGLSNSPQGWLLAVCGPPPCSHPHHLGRKKGTSLSWCLLLAEMVGFEPTCPIKDKTISSRSRYDHFDTSPYSNHAVKRSANIHTASPTALSLYQKSRLPSTGFHCRRGGRTQHQHARMIGIGQPVAADFPHKFPPVVEIFAKYYYFKAILYKRLPGSL